MSQQPLLFRLTRVLASIAATVAHTLTSAYRDAWGVGWRRTR